MASSCSTCKHWSGNNTEWYRDPKSMFAHVASDYGHGTCNALEMGPLDKDAYVRDGSDYAASLYSKPNFSCAFYEFGEPKRAINEQEFKPGYRVTFGAEPDVYHLVAFSTRQKMEGSDKFEWILSKSVKEGWTWYHCIFNTHENATAEDFAKLFNGSTCPVRQQNLLSGRTEGGWLVRPESAVASYASPA